MSSVWRSISAQQCEECQLYQQSIIINLMAFVFRSQKPQQAVAKPNPNVGPGSYNFDVHHENKIPKAYVPFGSMEPKFRETSHNIASMVGPGSYNIDVQHSGEKIIVSSQTEDIKILQISRPHPVFKSGVNRFTEIKEELITPGPGEYNQRGLQVRPKAVSTNTTTKPKILQHLINLNQYQSIPSIPSNIHAYGYNQNENNELQLNEPPIEYFKGEKEDKVGPGQYNPNVGIVKSRGISWSQPKSKKVQQVKVNQNIGPGSYEVTTISPLYNYKPSSNFASKTMRTMDQRKGAIVNTNQEIKEERYDNPIESRVMSEKGPASTHVPSDDEDSEYEYIDDTTPGPGSYLQISKVSRPKAGKTTTSFGGSKRFQSGAAVAAPGIVGPGAYNIGFKFGKQTKAKKAAKVKEEARCPSLINGNAKVPGPGSYEPRNTMQDKLIYKIQRGYRGQFGSTQVRSKDQQQDEGPAPGSYNPQLVNGEKQISSAFKSKIERKFVDEKRQGPAVGSYNIIHNDIATRVIKEEQEDPDLIIKKPGFGVGEARFKQVERPDDDYEDDDIIKEIQDKHREERRIKMLKNNSVFKSKQPRFKDPKKVAPGPGAYYDGEEDYWNKRTYNILFADI